MNDGEQGFLAGLFERHGRLVSRTIRTGKREYKYISFSLFRVPPHLAKWITDRVEGSRVLGKFLHFVTVSFVRPEDACKALVLTYPYLLDLKEPAQIYFRFVKSLGRQGARMSRKKLAEREELAKWLGVASRGN